MRKAFIEAHRKDSTQTWTSWSTGPSAAVRAPKDKAAPAKNTQQLHYESTAQADKEMDNIFKALAQGPHGANNGHLVDRHAPKTEQLRSMYWPLDVTVSLLQCKGTAQRAAGLSALHALTNILTGHHVSYYKSAGKTARAAYLDRHPLTGVFTHVCVHICKNRK